MKKAYFKDSKKMFKNNVGRFISIVLIIMLGTAFFIGMNAVSPAMKQTAENYMKENCIYDFYLTSNLGYEEKDIDRLKENKNIVEIQGIYSYDALASFDKKDIVVRLSSENNEINLNNNYIADGRDIEKDNECLISSRLKDMYQYEIGQSIKVYRKDETKIEDSLAYTEFEIVGITKNPIYLSKFYGNTTLLAGELSSYIIISESAFKLENYTTIYIKADIEEDISRFSDEYKEKSDDVFAEIEKNNEQIAKEKYDEIYSENVKTIENREEKIKNAEEVLNNNYYQIRSEQLQVNQAITDVSLELSKYYQIPNFYERIYDKQKAIKNSYTDLEQLEKRKNKLEDECEELRPKEKNLRNELESIENSIDKNLYELFSLEEAVKFVELNKENYKLYYEYNERNKEYQTINQEYESKKQELETVKQSIEETKSLINGEQEQLYSSFQGWKDLIFGIGISELNTKYQQIEEVIKKIEEANQTLEKQNLEEKILQAKTILNDKKNELKQFEIVAETTPLYENSGFKSLKEDLEKIAIMGKIFPVMFFVIAALVTITTITRMIEEDRKNIGTLKALGYGKTTIIKRYMIYALLAGIIGTVLGSLVGSLFIVEILFVSYSSMYDLPNLVTKINWNCILISLAISLFSTAFFAFIVTNKALKENTAKLMRPKIETIGKTIFLERIPIIWNKCNFLFKICFRNIFRHKKRLWMTLIGIAGCTALIYSGLGLQNAVNSIGNKQFKDIRTLSMEVFLKGEFNENEVKEIEEYIKQQEYVEETAPAKQQSLTVEAKENKKDVFYIAIDKDEASKYINLRDRKSQEKIELNDEGVVLTEKLANILDVTIGEKISITDDDVKSSAKVIGITENYLYNYVYFTPKMYERIYGKRMEYNEIYTNTTEIPTEEQEIKLSDNLKQNEKIASTVLSKNLEKEFKTSLASLISIVILFLACASILSFTVLINLNNINIEERKRELSTIKLLGFYQKELESYIFRENIILTILGTLLGLVLGMGILGVIIQAAEVETIFLVKEINYINLVISMIITIGFTLITNVIMKKKIKNIDMIDSLKSIE